jgi:hypothetical protein
MALQTAQLGGIVRYELLMHWRRRSLPALIGFVIAALIGFTFITSGDSFGATNMIVRVERDPADSTALIVTDRNDAGELSSYRITGEAVSSIPVWLIGMELEAVAITFQIVITVAFATQALLVALLPLMGETIPLDRQYKVRQLLDSTAIGRGLYFGGKLLGSWVGIIAGLLLASILFGVYSRFHYGGLDVSLYAGVWLMIVVPSALVASGWTILLNAFMASRRASVLLGLGLIPLIIILYLEIVMSVYYTIIATPQNAEGAYINYQALVMDLLSRAGGTMALYGLTVLALFVVVWLVARWRDAR